MVTHVNREKTVPEGEDVDVLASLLDVHRLTTVVAGRIDLAPPWRLDSEPTDLVSILVQAVGQSYLVRKEDAEPVVMNPGDVVIQLRGVGGGYIHDGSDPATTTWMLTPKPGRTATPGPLRLTPDNPASSFVCCLMRLGDAPRGPLLDSLPAVTHISTRASGTSGQIWRVAEMMISESTSPGPASTRLMSRLAEVLLILALRRQANDRTGKPGLRALADPLIAPAIKAIHADPGQHWSVASLAAICGLSRSAFAARFAETVGEAPHSYLTGWRMATAAKMLSTTDTTVDRIAEMVGYRSEAAFRRAFTAAIHRTPREYRAHGRR
ncbi:AraC family transcriptional regulator [Amycolatopsis taiwanensis]|uniref:Transcriptional regulator n=1 Tax=Amycolatopsis taiwanensis TaxID=342230 RepID=A0A9W6RA51_9PSEU|nr:AraC family transcriptional regulator [Amycolatopsis taiwanensis]GLY70225.1 transcriptional regulator [Amycolatopsis taiwanensis]